MLVCGTIYRVNVLKIFVKYTDIPCLNSFQPGFCRGEDGRMEADPAAQAALPQGLRGHRHLVRYMLSCVGVVLCASSILRTCAGVLYFLTVQTPILCHRGNLNTSPEHVHPHLPVQANDLPAAVDHLGGDQRRPDRVHHDHAGPAGHRHALLDLRALPVGLLHPAGSS